MFFTKSIPVFKKKENNFPRKIQVENVKPLNRCFLWFVFLEIENAAKSTAWAYVLPRTSTSPL